MVQQSQTGRFRQLRGHQLQRHRPGSGAASRSAGGLGLLAAAVIAGESFPIHWTQRGLHGLPVADADEARLAYSAYAWLTVHTSPVIVGSYGYVCPAVAALIGWLALGETLAGIQIAGMAVILAGDRAGDG